MSEYVRPVIPRQVFYDANGDVIDYGNRWPNHIAPEDTYSVVSHPERFAPLHAVADALIEHLRENYDLTVTDNMAAADDLMRVHDGAIRAVRLLPANPDGAPITFVFTSFPGVMLHAGLLQDFPFPDCGCDACDETAESATEALEEMVFAVVEGRFREVVQPVQASDPPFTAASREIIREFYAADGSRSSRGSHMQFEAAARVDAAEEALRQLPGGWLPWRRRP